ncbi:hypothetical protein ACMG4P_04820 [Pseudovibrio denitrificans]|uniref:hypothetical protein n=1 Tax=Pseudovibrio denitrificans TaxID=258256 RepID=UPI0039BFE16B
MIRSAEIRAKIMGHHHRGMSPRGIANIYGCSQADVKNVIETERAERIILSGVPVVGGKPLHPVKVRHETPETQALKLFEGLPEDLRQYAADVARIMNVPVAALLLSDSKREQDLLCRGCFYYGLSCEFHLTYEAISAQVGASVKQISRGIHRYCEQVGAPTPGKLEDERRAVA